MLAAQKIPILSERTGIADRELESCTNGVSPDSSTKGAGFAGGASSDNCCMPRVKSQGPAPRKVFENLTSKPVRLSEIGTVLDDSALAAEVGEEFSESNGRMMCARVPAAALPFGAGARTPLPPPRRWSSSEMGACVTVVI